MRRTVAILLTLLLGVVLGAPAMAKAGDVVEFKEKYAIPGDLADVEDPGELNHGCSGGLYTLVEGTFKKDATTTYLPSREAWDSGEEGAMMTVVGSNRYKGLWNVETDRDARFELRDDNLRFEFTFETGNADEPESVSFRWKGRFVDAETGDVAEWWDIDVTFDSTGQAGTIEGTCS